MPTKKKTTNKKKQSNLAVVEHEYDNILPPNKVKIGYVDYGLVGIPHDEAQLRDDSGVSGHILFDRHMINYDNSLNQVELLNTIIHECIHGIFHAYGFEFKNMKQEESVTNTVANGLTALFRENPEFVEWIKNSIKKK